MGIKLKGNRTAEKVNQHENIIHFEKRFCFNKGILHISCVWLQSLVELYDALCRNTENVFECINEIYIVKGQIDVVT